MLPHVWFVQLEQGFGEAGRGRKGRLWAYEHQEIARWYLSGILLVTTQHDHISPAWGYQQGHSDSSKSEFLFLPPVAWVGLSIHFKGIFSPNISGFPPKEAHLATNQYDSHSHSAYSPSGIWSPTFVVLAVSGAIWSHLWQWRLLENGESKGAFSLYSQNE